MKRSSAVLRGIVNPNGDDGDLHDDGLGPAQVVAHARQWQCPSCKVKFDANAYKTHTGQHTVMAPWRGLSTTRAQKVNTQKCPNEKLRCWFFKNASNPIHNHSRTRYIYMQKNNWKHIIGIRAKFVFFWSLHFEDLLLILLSYFWEPFGAMVTWSRQGAIVVCMLYDQYEGDDKVHRYGDVTQPGDARFVCMPIPSDLKLQLTSYKITAKNQSGIGTYRVKPLGIFGSRYYCFPSHLIVCPAT
jgi:hypothetical protein